MRSLRRVFPVVSRVVVGVSTTGFTRLLGPRSSSPRVLNVSWRLRACYIRASHRASHRAQKRGAFIECFAAATSREAPRQSSRKTRKTGSLRGGEPRGNRASFLLRVVGAEIERNFAARDERINQIIRIMKFLGAPYVARHDGARVCKVARCDSQLHAQMRIIRGGRESRGAGDVNVWRSLQQRTASIAADDNDTNSHCHSGYQGAPWASPFTSCTNVGGAGK